MNKTVAIPMDRLLGSIIDDYTLYKIIEGIIAILSLVMIYLGIQIALSWKSIRKERGNPDDLIGQRTSFFRSSIFIFIAGFFMVIHEFFEGLEKEAPDYTTYEFLELIALLGLVSFFYEWHRLLKNMKKNIEK
ncbi:Uncharacterised protein [uncultured archaeon]|nr:Uncharacterised protein [uncultured archaeon]